MPTRDLKIAKSGGPASIIDKNNEESWTRRVVIGIPNTGSFRAEWVSARFSQVIPTNWSHAEVWQMMSNYMPLDYQLVDAENLIAKIVVEQNYEWLLFIEADNVIPPNTFRKFNEYMISKKWPVVGGLYFTKSVPPEPLLYRGIGTGYFDKWKFGDKVQVDGLPFGCTLIHGDIIRALWEDSPEYIVNGQVTRRVFDQPNAGWYDHETGRYVSQGGTSDLAFCQKLIKGGYLAKAGWAKHQKMKYPFLVDTSIFVRHIDNNGTQWPLEVPEKYAPSQERMDEIMKEFSGPYK